MAASKLVVFVSYFLVPGKHFKQQAPYFFARMDADVLHAKLLVARYS